MREAAVPGYRLSKAKYSTRVLITLGMCGLLLGLLGSAATTLTKTGISPERVAAYYLGEAPPTGELDVMLAASGPRPFVELAEITHLHILGGSMMLFMLCHLLSVCDVRDRTRTGMYLVTFLSFLTMFSLPWAIIYVSRYFALLYGPASVVFLLSLVTLCLIPIKEMWYKKKKEPVADNVVLLKNSA